jgi:hypothetical protein
MKTFVTLGLFTTFLCPLSSQKLNFLRTIDFVGNYPQITHDRYGRSYVCNSNVYSQSQTDGSALSGFDSHGNQVLDKKWPQKFWIADLRYDGEEHFYACGTFSDEQFIDGIKLQSYGSTDCFVAKLDLNGKAVWIRTFGSTGGDGSGRLAYDASYKKLLCTGRCQSSMYAGSGMLDFSTEESIYVLAFDDDGKILSHSLSYFPGNTGTNAGTEVTCYNNTYYLLHNRAGKSWADDTSSLAQEGVYLAKLNDDLQMTWSTMIVNGGCYYGYSCGRIAQNSAGECFVPSYCRYKYGGNGILAGYNVSGAVTWSATNTDGSYEDTYSSGDNLYFIGTEGANGCPCESNNPGYQVVKKANSVGNLDYEYKFPDARFRRITANKEGIVTVLGIFYGDNYTVFNTTVFNPHPGEPATFIFSYCENECQQDLTPAALSEQTKGAGLEVFPNPASSVIKVRADVQSHEVILKVITVSGQVVKEAALRSAGGTLNASLDVADLPQGIYLIELSDAVSVRRLAFVRE